MSDEEKLITNFQHTGKAHEVALHRDDKKLHILRDKQHKLAWSQGVASAICGVMGRFSESHYKREMLIVLVQNRDDYCFECLDVLRKLRLSKYQTQGEIKDAGSDMGMQDKVVSIEDKIQEHACERELMKKKGENDG